MLSRMLVLCSLFVVAGLTAQAQGADAKKPNTKKEAQIRANLAKLPEADRKLAEKQKLCPVTDDPLGSMGVPVKVEVKNQTVFLCCQGCVEELKADPDKYLAKLKKP